MPVQITAPTLDEVVAARDAHDAAVVELERHRPGTHWRAVAADKAESAHRNHMRLAAAYWNALTGGDTDDTIERRVYRATDVLADSGVYAGKSPSDLAWALEEAGLLR